MYRSNVLVCGGTGCTSSNSLQIAEKLKEEIKKNGLEKEVNVITTGCFGLCALGPIMVVYPEGSFYSMVKIEDIPEIVEEHLFCFIRRQLLTTPSSPLTKPHSTLSKSVLRCATAALSIPRRSTTTSPVTVMPPWARYLPK